MIRRSDRTSRRASVAHRAWTARVTFGCRSQTDAINIRADEGTTETRRAREQTVLARKLTPLRFESAVAAQPLAPPWTPCLSGNYLGRRRGNHRGHRGHRSGFESPKALGAGSVSPGFSVVPFRQTRARLGYSHSNRAAAACVWLSGNYPRCAVGRRRGNHRGHRGHRSGFESPKALGAGSVSPAFSVVPFRQTRARLGYSHSNRAAAACVWLRGELLRSLRVVSFGSAP
jgi:hypothetical protein